MAKPGEGEEEGVEINSDRRNLITVATAAGLAGAVGMASGVAQAQQAVVKDPERPAGLKPGAELDGRFPVMYEASGEARKHTAAATSSAVPARPTGVWSAATRSTSVEDAVAIHPGATALIVIPSRAVSSATARIIPSIAALAAFTPKPENH